MLWTSGDNKLFLRPRVVIPQQKETIRNVIVGDCRLGKQLLNCDIVRFQFLVYR